LPGKSLDVCVAEKDANGCDMPCNVECKKDQKKCTFGNDENGCPREATCISIGGCCGNERECKPQEFDMSSYQPIWKEPVCVPMDQCCENEKQCDQGESGMTCVPKDQQCGNERPCYQEESGMYSFVPIDQCCENEKQCDEGEFGMSCVDRAGCCGNERECTPGEWDMSGNPPIWKDPICLPRSPCGEPLCPHEEESGKNCKPDEVFCAGQTNTDTDVDGNEYECPTPGECKTKEYSTCSVKYGEKAYCPKYCPNGEQLCVYTDVDSEGCNKPHECSSGGICPDGTV
jgi:hypothetical protein